VAICYRDEEFEVETDEVGEPARKKHMFPLLKAETAEKT